MSTILLVDDNPADRALFRIILGRAGFVVHELALGKEAIAKAKQHRPHVVVLDINLPDTDGHTLCRALKSDPETAGIPVLMLTVRQQESDVIAGLDAGADDYVAKDEPAPIILARIGRLVRYRQMAQSAMVNEQLAQIGRLLTGIVHEIRGPLSVLRGHAELLELLTKGNDELHEWVEPILRNAKLLQIRLAHLMAAVRTRGNRSEKLDLVSLSKEAIDLFQKGSDPHLPPPGIELVCESQGEIRISLDPGRMLLVLLNLLNNADEALRDAGRPEGKIRIQIGRGLRAGRVWIKLVLTDNGPGIPEVILGRVMEPFFTTKPDGSGYGLYLSSEIVAEMGGKLEASNREEGGACFTVWFPEPLDEPKEIPGLSHQQIAQPRNA